MNPVAALLVFLVAAVATVAISLHVQQRSSTESTRIQPSQLRELGHEHREDTGRSSTAFSDQRNVDAVHAREEELREARAARLEAVADRERRRAERAEAQARRLRESEDDGLGPAPRDMRARRAGVAPDDLDY